MKLIKKKADWEPRAPAFWGWGFWVLLRVLMHANIEKRCAERSRDWLKRGYWAHRADEWDEIRAQGGFVWPCHAGQMRARNNQGLISDVPPPPIQARLIYLLSPPCGFTWSVSKIIIWGHSEVCSCVKHVFCLCEREVSLTCRSHCHLHLPPVLSWFLVLDVQVAVNMETEPQAMIGRRWTTSQV